METQALVRQGRGSHLEEQGQRAFQGLGQGGVLDVLLHGRDEVLLVDTLAATKRTQVFVPDATQGVLQVVLVLVLDLTAG